MMVPLPAQGGAHLSPSDQPAGGQQGVPSEYSSASTQPSTTPKQRSSPSLPTPDPLGKPLTLRLPDEQERQLRADAERLNRSLSVHIRVLLAGTKVPVVPAANVTSWRRLRRLTWMLHRLRIGALEGELPHVPISLLEEMLAEIHMLSRQLLGRPKRDRP